MKFNHENLFLITNKFIRVIYERFSAFWLHEGYIKGVAATRIYLRERGKILWKNNGLRRVYV